MKEIIVEPSVLKQHGTPIFHATYEDPSSLPTLKRLQKETATGDIIMVGIETISDCGYPDETEGEAIIIRQIKEEDQMGLLKHFLGAHKTDPEGMFSGKSVTFMAINQNIALKHQSEECEFFGNKSDLADDLKEGFQN